MNAIDELDKRKLTIKKFKIERNKFKTWMRLQRDTNICTVTDCVVNVLFFLDVIKNRSFAEEMAKYVNTRARGMDSMEILNKLYSSNLEREDLKSYKLQFIKYDLFTPDYDSSKFDVLKKELKNNEGVFVGLKYKKKKDIPLFSIVQLGHAVFICKIDDDLWLVDPQQMNTVKYGPDLDKYITDHSIIQYVVAAEYPKRVRMFEDTTTKIRKNKQNSFPNKRTRKNSPVKQEQDDFVPMDISKSRSRSRSKSRSKSRSRSRTKSNNEVVPMDISKSRSRSRSRSRSKSISF